MDDLNSDSLQHLINKIPFIAWSDFLDKTESTNDDALTYLKSGRKENGIIVANYQISGKGRLNRAWESPKPGQDILMSLIVQPAVPISSWPRISFPLSLAIRQALVEYVPSHLPVQLKWPNDILINQQKCVGILIDAHPESNRIILGIGINVNQVMLDNDRTSLAQVNGVSISRYEVLEDILNAIQATLNSILYAKIDTTEWQSNAAFLNQLVAFNIQNYQYVGLFKGITEKGDLIIEQNNKNNVFTNAYHFRLFD